MLNKKKNEIKFSKYQIKGPDYHYKDIDSSKIATFNAYVFARYQIELELISLVIKNKYNNKNYVKILDVGCGDAVLFYLLNQKIKNLKLKFFGIDSSGSALSVARKKNSKGIFKKADLYNIPFEDNYFDMIISSDVIEHIVEAKKMLSEIKRVGKNNSIIIIGTPIRYTELPRDKMHYYEFFPQEFKDLLNDFFSDIKIIQSHKLRYFLFYNQILSIFSINKPFFRYLINILTVYFKRNPFLKIKTTDNEIYSYMFGIGKIKK
ncbi:Ubiquinone biosynthesis O-methyltransferase, mitochondrial [subsurface metagenome]